jgi:hypothetical protein
MGLCVVFLWGKHKRVSHTSATAMIMAIVPIGFEITAKKGRNGALLQD